MKLIEVADGRTRKEFLNLPVRLYKNVPAYIRPLDKDVEAVFDPARNKYFRHGELIRWILQNDQGETIGRVAAFINKKTINKGNDQPTGAMGFFDCINDQQAASMLFDACKKWLQDKGMEAMDGSINFGDRDRWWGVLAEGYDREPNYCMPYNFPYYTSLFENYGFQIYFRQLTYGRKVTDPYSPKIQEKADRVAQNPAYYFRHFRKKELAKFTDDFRTIYNKAWAAHSGVAKLSSAQAKNAIKQILPILDEKIIWFGYYNQDPVAFFIILPEVNQIFKHVNGKLDLLGKMKFAWHQFRKTNRKMYGLVFGVVPEHQGKGVEAALIHATRSEVENNHQRYDDFEMNWIGDFNPRMIHVVEQVGAQIFKVHNTYRYLFDRTKPFKRAPMINTQRENSPENSSAESGSAK